jgi:hypothetical protein
MIDTEQWWHLSASKWNFMTLPQTWSKPVRDSGCKYVSNLCFVPYNKMFTLSTHVTCFSPDVFQDCVCVHFTECKSWSRRLTTVRCRNFRKSARSAGDHQRCTPTSIWHCKYVGIVEHNDALYRKASIPGQVYTVRWNGVYPHCDRSSGCLLYVTADSAVGSLHLSVCFAKPKNNFLKTVNPSHEGISVIYLQKAL